MRFASSSCSSHQCGRPDPVEQPGWTRSCGDRGVFTCPTAGSHVVERELEGVGRTGCCRSPSGLTAFGGGSSSRPSATASRIPVEREGFLSVTFDSLWLTNQTDPKRVRVRTFIRISEARHEQHNGVPPLPGLVRRRCQSVSQLWQMDPSAGLLPDSSTKRARPLLRDRADRRTPVLSQSSLHLVPRRNTDALLVGRLDDSASFLGLSARLLRRLDRPG